MVFNKNEKRTACVTNCSKGIYKINGFSEKNGKITNDVAEGVDVGSWPEFNYATNVITNSGTLTVDAGTLETLAVALFGKRHRTCHYAVLF